MKNFGIFAKKFCEIFLGEPCVVLCGIKRNKDREHTARSQKQKQMEKSFSKSTPVFPRLLWTKTSKILSLKKS